ncbi:cyclic nucleotide-binding domain-containing protein [Mesorhizobium sp. Z1-4]|uniref:cyclic nucleotide-binding domain-containing protein n=1 Tax=Mesorhizobium sp. Z1-4 TaxID=2448478 RepID=UPI000FDA57FA|nr:cyclic nucleotide-binding domain-containing protein [Mesorhizobium sp. Z1-4]
MALDDDIRILERVKLFEDFSSDQLRLLAFGAETLRLRAGRDLYREGAPSDCAYVVASGKIELSRSRGGENVTAGEAGPGTVLGELSLISGGKRVSTATAAVDSEVIRLNRSLFRRILEEYPEVAAKLHARISANMKSMLDEIGSLGRHFAE